MRPGRLDTRSDWQEQLRFVDDGFELLRGRPASRQVLQPSARLHVHEKFHQDHLRTWRSHRLRKAICQAGAKRQSTERRPARLSKAQGLLRRGDERLGAIATREENHRSDLCGGSVRRAGGHPRLWDSVHASKRCLPEVNVWSSDESGQLVVTQ